MTKGIFMTGTGTDVGKTFVSSLLLKKMKEEGLNCGYYKPVLSGSDDAELNDSEYVVKTAGLNTDPKACVTFSYHPALSPHLAAQIENNPVSIEKIKEHFKTYTCDYLITEGAGGIVCPLNTDKILLKDLIKALNLDVIIVASAALGTINSTVLTVEYCKNHGINVKGIILNRYDKTDIMHRDNKEMIEKLTGIKVIATVEDKEAKLEMNEFLSLFKEITHE